MQPTLSIFGAGVSAYTFFAAAGAVAAMALAIACLRRMGLPLSQAALLPLAMGLAFLVGARLWNWCVNPGAYGGGLYLLSLRLRGLSLYGGLLFSLAALLLFARRTRRSCWALLDAMILPGGGAFAIARVGCFLGGCCGGKPTQSALGMVFPPSELMGKLPFFAVAAQAVYPTQLFELGLALLGLAVILPLSRRLRLAQGSAALLYAMWFTAMRWAILPLRALPYGGIVTDVAYPTLYGLLILACGLLFYRRNKTCFAQIAQIS